MIDFLKDLLKPYKKLVVTVLLVQLAQAVLSLMLPRLNSGVINRGIVQKDYSYIWFMGAIMLVMTALQFFCSVYGSVLGGRIALSSSRDLRLKVFEKTLKLSQKDTMVLGAPTLITNTTNDVQQVATFITFLFTSIVSAPLMFIGGLVIALQQSLRLSSVLLVLIPLMLILSITFMKRVLPYYEKNQAYLDRMNAVVRDQITGVRVVRAFNREKLEHNKMTHLANDMADINTTINRTLGVLSPLFTIVVNVSSIALLWIGAIQAQYGDMMIGDVISFITYISMILTATLMASMVFMMLPRAQVSADRICKVFDYKPDIEEAAYAKAMPSGENELCFNHVYFSYMPENKDVANVLKDITFTAKPGQTTAIIGSTGSGKSTILNMIPRLMDPTSGRVTYGGIDLKDIKLDDIVDNVGLVPQKAFLFAGSLAHNLKMGRKNATEDEMWQALKVAQAEDFIKTSEGQLQMQVSEAGSNYSGGQRQRLAIARAIVKKPKIYLFDDSFSALDYATDLKLRTELKKITTDAIVLIVGQRISSIMDADQIIVLNNGQIEDIGRHEELLKRCRVYREIAKSQLKEDQ